MGPYIFDVSDRDRPESILIMSGCLSCDAVTFGLESTNLWFFYDHAMGQISLLDHSRGTFR